MATSNDDEENKFHTSNDNADNTLCNNADNKADENEMAVNNTKCSKMEEATVALNFTNDSKSDRTVNPIREVFPQFMANSLINIISVDLAIIMNFSTLLIAGLHNARDDVMSLDDNAASWVASMAYMCQPLGSLCSGFVVEAFGRKGGLLLVNIPYLIAWIILWTSRNVAMLLLANLVTGIAVGLTEAPLINYTGEVTQPHIRGTVTASGSMFYQLGMLIVYLMGTVTHWRTTAAICTSIPVLSFFLVMLLPETPVFLVSKGRIKDAEKSLCWLRGWVEPSTVKRELQELIQHYQKAMTKPGLNNSKELRIQATPTPGSVQEAKLLLNEAPTVEAKQNVFRRFANRFLELLELPTLRPMLVIMPLYFTTNFTGVASVRPFMVHVFRGFRTAVEAEWMTVLVSICNNMASLALIFTVKLTGKRPIVLVCTAVCSVLSLLLGTHAVLMGDAASWTPVVLFLALTFCSTVVMQIPWIMISEVFPFRTRGLASGVGAAGLYLMVFGINNTYLRMEQVLGLHGSFWLFGVVNGVALVYYYFAVPETEGKKLHEIEAHFQKGLFFKP